MLISKLVFCIAAIDAMVYGWIGELWCSLELLIHISTVHTGMHNNLLNETFARTSSLGLGAFTEMWIDITTAFAEGFDWVMVLNLLVKL